MSVGLVYYGTLRKKGGEGCGLAFEATLFILTDTLSKKKCLLFAMARWVRSARTLSLSVAQGQNAS